MMKFRSILLFKIAVLLFFISAECYSQIKDEKEFKVRRSEFPNSSLKLIDSWPKAIKKLRYLKETDGEKESFEAKFKSEGSWYSVEFSESGELEDIEVKIKKGRIDPKTLQKIIKHLKGDNKSFKFVKIQKQFVYAQGSDPESFVNAIFNDSSIAFNYEIVAELKSNSNKIYRQELLFDQQGELISVRPVKTSGYDHISY